MRPLTLIASAAAALAAACPAPAAAAALRPVELQSPAVGSVLTVAPHADGIAGEVSVKGRAARGATIELRARCALGPCVTTATADRRGRWRASITIVRRSVRSALTLRARYVDAPGPGLTGRSSVRLALPAWASAPPYAGTPQAPLLAVIGDSLAVGTEIPLRQLLPDWRVTSVGSIGRSLADGMALLERTPIPAQRAVWAFSLFTNDDPRNAAALQAAVRSSLDRIGAGNCAIWATIARPRLAGVSYKDANRQLHALASEPGLSERLVIVPWAEAVAEHREWLRDDRVHPTPEGYAARAQMFADAAGECHVGEGVTAQQP